MKQQLFIALLTLPLLAQDPLPPKPTAPADIYVIVVNRSLLNGATQTQLSTFVNNNPDAVVAAAIPATGVEILNAWAWRHGVSNTNNKAVHRLIMQHIRAVILQMAQQAPGDNPQSIQDLTTTANNAAAAAQAAIDAAAGGAIP